MSTDPNPTAPPPTAVSRLARCWKYVAAAVAVIGWGIAAYQAWRTGEPIPAPPADSLNVPVQTRADDTANGP